MQALNGNFCGFHPGYTRGGNYGAPALGPQAQPLPASFPMDSVALSGANSGNFNFGVQDVCDCRLDNPLRDAFIVPVGDQDNPFANYNAAAVSLPQGNNPHQELMNLLVALGFTAEMIAMLAQMGIDLMGLITQANGMQDFGSIQPGQEMVLPTTLPANSNTAYDSYDGSGQSSGGSSTPAPAEAAPQAPAPATEAAAPAPAARPTRNDGSREEWINPSDVHLYNQALEAERRQAAAQGRTVLVNGEYVNPSDVHLHHQAAEAERRQATAQGRTVRVNDEYVNPSDVHLHRQAQEGERNQAHAEGRTVRAPRHTQVNLPTPAPRRGGGGGSVARVM